MDRRRTKRLREPSAARGAPAQPPRQRAHEIGPEPPDRALAQPTADRRQPTQVADRPREIAISPVRIISISPNGRIIRSNAAIFSLGPVISTDSETRGQVMQFADIFRGKVIDVSKRSMTIEITGTDDKIEAFEQLIRPFGLIEMIRTGEIAISRGRSAT